MPGKKPVALRPTLKLYWCSTDDHDEDWFVVARQAREAARFFRDYEGYDGAQVFTELALVLPNELQDEKYRGWPTRKLLLAAGATIRRWETPRVVELDGIQWVEGMLEHRILELEDDLFERSGKGRPNNTSRARTS
jgi:hypothetical protein